MGITLFPLSSFRMWQREGRRMGEGKASVPVPPVEGAYLIFRAITNNQKKAAMFRLSAVINEAADALIKLLPHGARN